MHPFPQDVYALPPAVDLHVLPHGGGLYYLEPAWSEHLDDDPADAVVARNLRTGAWNRGDDTVRMVIEDLDDYSLIRAVSFVLRDDDGWLRRKSRCLDMPSGQDTLRITYRSHPYRRP